MSTSPDPSDPHGVRTAARPDPPHGLAGARYRRLRGATVATVIVALLLVAAWWALMPAHSFGPAMADATTRLQRAVAERPVLAVAAFVTGYLAVCTLNLPGATALTMTAGAVFGVPAGLLIVSVSSTVGAVLALAVARTLLQSRIRARYPDLVSWIEGRGGEDSAWLLLAMRLFPGMPFFLVNLLFAMTDLPIRRFAWVSQLGMLPAATLYLSAGQELARMGSGAEPMPTRALALLAGIATLLIVGRLVRRRLLAPR
jgi:uncharacterized membrane protein YdjX (TVP38/TMEM64 family)